MSGSSGQVATSERRPHCTCTSALCTGPTIAVSGLQTTGALSGPPVVVGEPGGEPPLRLVSQEFLNRRPETAGAPLLPHLAEASRVMEHQILPGFAGVPGEL